MARAWPELAPQCGQWGALCEAWVMDQRFGRAALDRAAQAEEWPARRRRGAQQCG